MVDFFDEYRKRWVYKCTVCNEEITAFRDCGKTTNCRCGSAAQLTGVIEPKHIECTGDCNINVHTFKPYFDVTLGKVVESKHEITEFCKRNDMIYAGDKELTQQCAQNKRENELRQDKAFTEKLIRDLMRL